MPNRGPGLISPCLHQTQTIRDLGIYCEDGFLFLLGRVDFVIGWGGEGKLTPSMRTDVVGFVLNLTAIASIFSFLLYTVKKYAANSCEASLRFY